MLLWQIIPIPILFLVSYFCQHDSTFHHRLLPLAPLWVEEYNWIIEGRHGGYIIVLWVRLDFYLHLDLHLVFYLHLLRSDKGRIGSSYPGSQVGDPLGKIPHLHQLPLAVQLVGSLDEIPEKDNDGRSQSSSSSSSSSYLPSVHKRAWSIVRTTWALLPENPLNHSSRPTLIT